MGKSLAVSVALAAVVGAAFLLLSAKQGSQSEAIERTPGATPDQPATREGDAVLPRGGEAPVLVGAASKPRAAETVVGGVKVVGRVVDERRRPVAGADVTARVEGREVRAAVTKPDGRFAIRVGDRPAEGWRVVAVRARDAARAGFAQGTALSRTSPDAVDVGTIVLKAGGDLDVVVTHAGAPVAGATVHLVGGLWQSVLLEAPTDAAGRATLPGVPHGPWRVLATAPGLGRGAADVVHPAATPVRIDLPVERVIAVTVVEKGSGKPIEGAIVVVHEVAQGAEARSTSRYMPPPDVAPTDAEGRTQLRGLGEESVRVLAVRKGQSTNLIAGRAQILAKDATEARIELPAVLAVRWKVLARTPDGSAAPVPPDGAEVRLRRLPGAATEGPEAGRMQGDELVVEGVPGGLPFIVTAVAPDGTLAALLALPDRERGENTFFRAPRRIEVVAKNADGSPASGWITLRTSPKHPAVDPAPLDAEGHAVVSDLYGGPAEVLLGFSPQEAGASIGSVDLDAGDGRVTASLPDEIEIVVRVTVDGERRLPPEYTLFAGPPQEEAMVGPSVPARVDEDPEAGELRVHVRPPSPGAPIAVAIMATGYLQVAGTAAPPAPLELALSSGARVLVRVVPPKDGMFSVQAERWNAERKEWFGAGVGGFGLPGPVAPVAGAGATRELGPFAPGRYRILDRSSGTVGPELDLVASPRPVETSFDLSSVGFLAGRVEGPPGESIEGAMVAVSGALARTRFAPTGPPNAQPVGKDGTFRLRLPGDRPITLTAWHPVFAAAPEGGSITFTGLPSSVTLRLARSTTGTVRLDPTPAPGSDWVKPRVLLFRGEPTGEPVSTHQLVASQGTYRFGGYSAGTYTAWVDVTGYAPVVLKDVVLGAAATDLGTLRLGSGSSLRVRILAKEGERPQASVQAIRATEPTYTRFAESKGQSEVVVSGIGPGTFRVIGWSPGGSKAPLDQTVELDGTTDRELTLDLR